MLTTWSKAHTEEEKGPSGKAIAVVLVNGHDVYNNLSSQWLSLSLYTTTIIMVNEDSSFNEQW